MAVCSTPSSPLGPGVPGMVPLLKFRFTDTIYRFISVGTDGKQDVSEGSQEGLGHC